MKVILLKDVAKLGRKYDIKTVSDGHAINLLIPQGLAVTATPEAIKRNEVLRATTEVERKVQEELLFKNIEGLDGVTITIVGKANDKGHLFAGLHKEVIADEIQKQTRLQIDPSFIQLEHPLKTVGDYLVEGRGPSSVEGSGGAKGKLVKLKVVVEKM